MIEDEKRRLEVDQLKAEIQHAEEQLARDKELVQSFEEMPDSEEKRTGLQIAKRDMALTERRLAEKRQALKALLGN